MFGKFRFLVKYGNNSNVLFDFSTSWKSQPYSRGSYTSIAVGASQEDIENIALPLYSNPQQSKV